MRTLTASAASENRLYVRVRRFPVRTPLPPCSRNSDQPEQGRLRIAPLRSRRELGRPTLLLCHGLEEIHQHLLGNVLAQQQSLQNGMVIVEACVNASVLYLFF